MTAQVDVQDILYYPTMDMVRAKNDHDGHLVCSICHAQVIVMWHTQTDISWDAIVASGSLDSEGKC